MNERIKKIREKLCNGSNTEFAKVVGESPNTTSNWMSRSVNLEVIVKILKAFPNVSVDWLVLDEGNMLKSQPGETSSIEDVDYREKYYNLLEENGKLSNRLIGALGEIISLKDELSGEKGKKDTVQESSDVSDVKMKTGMSG